MQANTSNQINDKQMLSKHKWNRSEMQAITDKRKHIQVKYNVIHQQKLIKKVKKEDFSFSFDLFNQLIIWLNSVEGKNAS